MNGKSLKELVLERYGSIDNFIKETSIDLSRPYIFRLLHEEGINPTVSAIIKLAEALNLDTMVIIEEYSSRYRDIWARNKQQD